MRLWKLYPTLLALTVAPHAALAFAGKLAASTSAARRQRHTESCRATSYLKIGIIGEWIFGVKDSSHDTAEDGTGTRDGKLGGVAGIMDSMESFRKAQRLGKITNLVLSELASSAVEGFSQDGKVKAIFDGQQRPIRVEIDETFFESADATDVAMAVTMAMKDAHAKSVEKMDDRLNNFFNEMGFPPR